MPLCVMRSSFISSLLSRSFSSYFSFPFPFPSPFLSPLLPFFSSPSPSFSPIHVTLEIFSCLFFRNDHQFNVSSSDPIPPFLLLAKVDKNEYDKKAKKDDDGEDLES